MNVKLNFSESRERHCKTFILILFLLFKTFIERQELNQNVGGGGVILSCVAPWIAGGKVALSCGAILLWNVFAYF